jgi:diguanylate cyclase with GGDEF domain
VSAASSKQPPRTPLAGLLRRDAYPARHGDDTSVVLVDADHFKANNDRLGRAAGDVVLAALGARLTAFAGARSRPSAGARVVPWPGGRVRWVQEVGATSMCSVPRWLVPVSV